MTTLIVLCKKSFHFYCLGYSESTFGKMTKNSKSRLVYSDCKTDFESGISSYKKSVTLQSLAETVNFMGIKFDDFNNTVTKLLNEIKELREKNKRVSDINNSLSKEVNQLKLKIYELVKKQFEKVVDFWNTSFLKWRLCIAQEVGNKLNVKIQVEKAFRISVKNNQFSKIIVCLKDKTISQAVKKIVCFANQINKGWSNSMRIYIKQILENIYHTKQRKL